MKIRNTFIPALFVLSVPLAYLTVWISADITAYFKNVPYNIPLGRVALSASLLFVITLAFSQILKDRHTSLLRIIGVSLITVITAYLALAVIESIYWSSTIKNETPNKFGLVLGIRIGVYWGRFIPVSLCVCLIALIVRRNLILKNQNKSVSETF